MPSDKHNILIIVARYPGYGGIECVTTQLANHLALKGRVVIASLRQQEMSLLSNLSSSIKFVSFPYGGLEKNKENVVFLNQLIETENIDTIIYQDSYFPCQYLLEAKCCHHLKIIAVEHSSPNCFEKEYELTKGAGIINRIKGLIDLYKSYKNELRRRQLIYDVCCRYIVLSKQYIPDCLRIGKITDDSKFRVIGNPLSFDVEDVNLNDKINECLFVGRIDRVKGLDRLIRIWHHVENKISGWKLTIVGDGPAMSEIKRLISQFRLKNISLEGYKKDVRDYYYRAKIYCMCSSYEGFPMVLPEAMANGLVPVVFNSFGAINDIIDNGDEGISIAPFNENEYAETLISLMRDESRLRQMQEACIRRSKFFLPENIFVLWDNLLNEIYQ